MSNNLYTKLFDFDVDKYKKISISKNEIYNQFLLYIFFTSKKNLLLVLPTLNEATELYNELKTYVDDVYLFPEDDIITKTSIAVSPELLFMRANLLNKINDDTRKIVIVHLNSFIKKLPSKNKYNKNRISFKKGTKINREELINKLIEIGYKRESIVYNTSDFSVRGFVIDIYPIEENHPIRLELFDEEIEKIKYFDEYTQKSIEEIDEISIGPIKDDFGDNNTSIKEFFEKDITIYTNYNQLLEQEKMLKPQIKYLNIENDLFKVKDLVEESDIYIDTINNKNAELTIEAKSLDKYNYDKERFINDIKSTGGILYTTNKQLTKEIKNIDKNIKIENLTLNKGFVYKNTYYFSEFDLYDTYSRKEIKHENSLGHKILSIDSINEGD